MLRKSQRFSPFAYMLLLSLVARICIASIFLISTGKSRVNSMDLENTGNHNSSIVTSLIKKTSKTEATGGCPNELTMKELLLKVISPILVQFLNCTLNYALLPGIIPFLMWSQFNLLFTLLIHSAMFWVASLARFIKTLIIFYHF